MVAHVHMFCFFVLPFGLERDVISTLDVLSYPRDNFPRFEANTLSANAKFLKLVLGKETGGQVASWHSSQAVLVPATNFEINIQAPAI